MKTIKLNSQGRIPTLGLGTWKSETSAVYEAVRHAIRIGYRHIDCAAIYGNEQTVGQAVNDALQAGEVKRDQLWITSKLWNSFHHQYNVVPALQQTLRDLGLDYIDLYLVHWPIAFKPEVGLAFPESKDQFLSLEQVPLTETWQGMEQACRQGLTRHIGVSNFSQNKLDVILKQCEIPPAMNQVESHPYLAQDDLLTYCRQHDIAMTAYAPLGSKDRPAKLQKNNEPNLLDHPVIKDVATKHDATTAQVLIAWHLQRDVVVIPKSVTPQRIEQNYEAQQLTLSEHDMQQIAELDRGYRFVDGSVFEHPESGYTLDNIWR